jgi:molybdenum cofactor cytidylyltransferase
MYGSVNVVAVVLAAGTPGSGGRKQLLPVRGEPMLRRTTRQVLGSRCTGVAVVVGAYGDDVAPVIADLAVDVLFNDAWRDGISTSLRAAARWATAREADAVVVLACDQPMLSSVHLDALLDAFMAAPSVVGSSYAGTVGLPALFPRGTFARLEALTGHRGAETLLAGSKTVIWDHAAPGLDRIGDHDVERDLQVPSALQARWARGDVRIDGHLRSFLSGAAVVGNVTVVVDGNEDMPARFADDLRCGGARLRRAFPALVRTVAAVERDGSHVVHVSCEGRNDGIFFDLFLPTRRHVCFEVVHRITEKDGLLENRVTCDVREIVRQLVL